MKKIIVLIIAIAVVIGLFAIMINNKKKSDQKAKSVEIMTVVPVNVASVLKDKSEKLLTIVGLTAPTAEINVTAEVTGKVMELKGQVGDIISKGSMIAKIDDELKVANYNLAEANFEKAKKDLERYQSLLNEKSVNDVQFEQVKLNVKMTESNLIAAKKQLTDCKVLAPFTGMITARPIEVGTVLAQGNQMIASMIDVSSLKVKLNVPEKDVFLMKIGDEVKITTDISKESFTGRIRAIVAKADEAHTYPVEILIPNKGNQLKAGMFVKTEFSKILKNETLLIPRAALIGSIKDPKVYTIEGDVAKLIPIVVGDEVGTNLEILSGLKEGQIIIVNGQLNLVDGSKVSVVK